LLGGFIAGSWFVRRNNWSIYKIGDIVAPALALGQAVGYLGCVFSGCSAPVAWPVLVFYSGLFGLITCLKKEKTFIGFPALFYLVSSTLFDFAVGFFRRTPRWWLVFNFDQVLALVIFVAAVLALQRRLKKSGMKVKLKLPKKLLEDLKARLTRSEREMEQQKLTLEEQDPYLQEGRTENNAEFVEDAGEDIGHTRIELFKGVLDSLLREIKLALAKMHLGTYGICEECREAIDPARLKANPSATLCLRCERKKELAPVKAVGAKKTRRGK
ncbi:TraR/DksA C4-type zinc finger protein, partial [Candidatus Parcubacteria bacterium]|nr:TraR/DksA C4-type zinc finger protein [Candidatus Parcubacteria bacterium]